MPTKKKKTMKEKQRQKHPLCSNSDREPAMRQAVYQPERPRDVTTTPQGKMSTSQNVKNIGKKTLIQSLISEVNQNRHIVIIFNPRYTYRDI